MPVSPARAGANETNRRHPGRAIRHQPGDSDAGNARIIELHEQGWTNVAIGADVGCAEGTVRNVLDSQKRNSSEIAKQITQADLVAEDEKEDTMATAVAAEQAIEDKRAKLRAEEKKAQKRAEREEELDRQREEIEQGAVSAPDSKYDVIVLDPPWNYGRKYDPEGSR